MKRKIIAYDPWLKRYAKALRNDMTFSEVALWKKLRNKQMLGYDFDRQKPLLHFIVDFYCKELRLAIEVDGMTHDDEQVITKDECRDKQLLSIGIIVLRFSSYEIVHRMQGVLQHIEDWIETRRNSTS